MMDKMYSEAINLISLFLSSTDPQSSRISSSQVTPFQLWKKKHENLQLTLQKSPRWHHRNRRLINAPLTRLQEDGALVAGQRDPDVSRRRVGSTPVLNGFFAVKKVEVHTKKNNKTNWQFKNGGS